MNENFSDLEYAKEYTVLYYHYDENNKLTKSIGSSDNNDFMSIYNDSEFTLERHEFSGDSWDIFEFKYKEGLGEILYENHGFEWSESRELVAYSKDNDTIGTLTNDEYFSNIDENNLLPSITIYPNPANDIVNIKLENGYIIKKLRILELNGAIIKTEDNVNRISIADLNPSLYIIEIISDKLIIRQKLLVK